MLQPSCLQQLVPGSGLQGPSSCTAWKELHSLSPGPVGQPFAHFVLSFYLAVLGQIDIYGLEKPLGRVGEKQMVTSQWSPDFSWSDTPARGEKCAALSPRQGSWAPGGGVLRIDIFALGPSSISPLLPTPLKVPFLGKSLMSKMCSR